MSDHLLRLARIVAGIAYDQWHPNDSRSVAMDQLVRDLEAAPVPVDDRASRRAADLLISHFGGQSLEDAVEKAVAVRYMKREEGIIPPWEMHPATFAPARRTITREEWEWMRDWIGQAFANDVRERLRLTVEG